jgi:predicted DCC family thiol-disulfide oxidoreductase YuxK
MGRRFRSLIPRLSSTKAYSPLHFTAVRVALGAFLAWHFGRLWPHALLLFSEDGLVPNPALNPWHGWLPNPLDAAGAWLAPTWCALGVFLAAALALGWWRRYVAVALWLVWAVCADRNALLATAALPYVGLLLLFLAAVPDGEPLRLAGRRRGPGEWFMPTTVYAGMWWLLAAGYAFSGAIKVGRAEWLDGEALRILLQQPLARPGGVRDWLLAQPEWITRTITWTMLAGECAFLPLCLTRAGRWVAWIGMVMLQVCLLFVLDCTELTLAMLLAHAFVFDSPGWLPPRVVVGRQPTLLYDGECGLCQASVYALLREDVHHVLRVATLQSVAGQSILKRLGLPRQDFESMVFLPAGDGDKYSLRTSAVCDVLSTLGGPWALLAWLRIIPPPLRDIAYRLVARFRRKLAGPPRPALLRDRFWDHQFLD